MQVMIPHNLAPGQPLLVTLPGGGQTRMHNGDRGFFIRHCYKLRVDVP